MKYKSKRPFNKKVRENFKEGLFGKKGGGGFRMPKIPSPSDILKTIDFSGKVIDPVKKGLDNGLVKPVTDGTKGIFNDIKKGFEKDIIKPFEKNLIKQFNPSKGIDEVIGFFSKKIVPFFKRLPGRLEAIGLGFKDVFVGIGISIAGLGKGIGLGFENSAYMFGDIAELISTYIQCIIKMLVNLPFCFWFYVVKTILYIFYLPFVILLWISKNIFGLDFYQREKAAWRVITDLSYLCYRYTGYHLIYFPKHIRERCFVCIRLKAKRIEDTADDIDNAFNKKLPAMLKAGQRMIETAFDGVK